MATISNTAGGSGNYTLGQVTGPITLFTTPNVANTIFIVYVTTVGSVNNSATTVKVMIGPNAGFQHADNTSFNGTLAWNWVQMEIS